eukprot:SAG11_NODE_724_length_7524_cov_6.241481_8_plen_214_part_00
METTVNEDLVVLGHCISTAAPYAVVLADGAETTGDETQNQNNCEATENAEWVSHCNSCCYDGDGALLSTVTYYKACVAEAGTCSDTSATTYAACTEAPTSATWTGTNTWQTQTGSCVDGVSMTYGEYRLSRVFPPRSNRYGPERLHGRVTPVVMWLSVVVGGGGGWCAGGPDACIAAGSSWNYSYITADSSEDLQFYLFWYQSYRRMGLLSLS